MDHKRKVFFAQTSKQENICGMYAKDGCQKVFREDE